MADSEDIRVPKAQLLSFGETVAITVKENSTTEKCYHVQANLVKGRSPFIRKQLELPFHHPLSKRGFTLYSCNLEAFESYCHYIYTHAIPCVMDANRGASSNPGWEELVDFFLLSKRLEDSEAMDAALNALLHTYDSLDSGLPSFKVVSSVYKNTDSKSPLRRLLVDMYRWAATVETLDEEEADALPFVFYTDLTKALLQEKAELSRDIPSGVSCCDYHVHDASAECLSGKRKRDESEDNEKDQNGESKEG